MNPPGVIKRLVLSRAFRALIIVTLAPLCLASARAGDANVIRVQARERSSGVFDLDVTVRSNDTGWDRYADRIEAVGPKGEILGTRLLDHPHETEQPFTRDLHDLRVPAGIARITVRARFKPTGEAGDAVTIALPGR